MKITKIGNPEVIMDNPYSKHRYFGWPTAARLRNGKIAVVASGFRLRHVCPFGKTVIAFSEDESKTYSLPTPVIDTPLDDRDGGITPFGENSLIVTSFNHFLSFQRSHPSNQAYDLTYLDTVTPEEEELFIGATYRISHDGGITFGPIYKAPVSSPHGPVELADGSLLWVGRTWPHEPCNTGVLVKDCIRAYRINTDGTSEFVGEIKNIETEEIRYLSCEPHTIALKDGTLLTHIRVQCKGEHRTFTIYQSKSSDGGKTWSKPLPILPQLGGAPPHLLQLSSGLLVCTYSHREEPYGIRAMFSRDGGESWDAGYELYVNDFSNDLGYPSTVELADGSLTTVFYAHPKKDGYAAIMQQKWRIDDEI